MKCPRCQYENAPGSNFCSRRTSATIVAFDGLAEGVTADNRPSAPPDPAVAIGGA